MIIVMTAIVVAILFVTLRGDQIGLDVQGFGPQGTASSRATVRLTLDENIIPMSAASRMVISPAVQGNLSVQGNQIVFQPSTAFSQGQQYVVTVRAGLQGKDGRLLKQDVQWKFQASGARIVYAGPADSNTHDLFLLDPQSAQPAQSVKQLTHSQKGILSFDVAPDGSSIVYAELQTKQATNLYILDVASGATRLLYACPDSSCNDPAWSPDGKWIAFEKALLDAGLGTPGSPRIWLIDPVTGNAKKLFSGDQQLGYSPRWSPDSQRIAVVDANAGGIVVHNLNTQTDLFIPTIEGDIGSFSPDGKWLTVPKIVDPGEHHFVLVDVSSDLPVQHDLIPDDDLSDDLEATWMADSKSLLVARMPPDLHSVTAAQLYYVDARSGQASPVVVDQTYSHTSLQVSPTGEEVLFQRFPLDNPGGHTELWTFNLATHALTRLVVNGTSGRWLP